MDCSSISLLSVQIDNESGVWVKLADEAMHKLGCSGTASMAYALEFSKDKQKKFLEDKEVRQSLTTMIKIVTIFFFNTFPMSL